MRIRNVQELVEALGDELELNWDGADGDTQIQDNISDSSINSPVGPLNLTRPNQIQVIGPPEQTHLLGGEKEDHQQILKQLFETSPAALIFTDGLTPTNECVTSARSTQTAILRTGKADHKVLRHLLDSFSEIRGETLLVHGVFMEVLGKGVLLSGDPGIGKSELALALISRGHRLVADDATELYKTHSQTIMGRCPMVLQDFLEVNL